MAEDEPKSVPCPRCGEDVSAEPDDRSAYFPFCSRKCKLVDLGNWLEGRYSISDEDRDPGSEEGDTRQ